MTDFAAAGKADTAGFTDRVRREIIMQHEVFAICAFQRIDKLLIIARAQSGDHQRLRFTAREQA